MLLLQLLWVWVVGVGVGHGDGDGDGGGVGGLRADRAVRLSSFSWSYWCAIYIFATEDKPMTHIYSNPQALTPTHGACVFHLFPGYEDTSTPYRTASLPRYTSNLLVH